MIANSHNKASTLRADTAPQHEGGLIMNRLLRRFTPTRSTPASHPSETLVRVGCPAHNCGGRCLLIAHVQDGVITRLDTDDRPDVIAAP